MARLTPFQRAYVRKRTKKVELDPSEVMDELNIVPFLDIVVNLIMFLLMSLTAVAFFNQVVANLPKSARGTGSGGQPTLNLTLFVLPSGIRFTGSGGTFRPDCATTGTGRTVTVPLVNGAIDWNAVTECAAKIKQRFPDEERITVSPDQNVEFQELIRAMDSVRAKGQEPLFPQVLLSAGVR